MYSNSLSLHGLDIPDKILRIYVIVSGIQISTYSTSVIIGIPGKSFLSLLSRFILDNSIALCRGK